MNRAKLTETETPMEMVRALAANHRLTTVIGSGNSLPPGIIATQFSSPRAALDARRRA